jgi:hypothetical protein
MLKQGIHRKPNPKENYESLPSNDSVSHCPVAKLESYLLKFCPCMQIDTDELIKE